MRECDGTALRRGTEIIADIVQRYFSWLSTTHGRVACRLMWYVHTVCYPAGTVGARCDCSLVPRCFSPVDVFLSARTLLDVVPR